MKLLEGKVAVVTGAARGIGKAIALQFAREGANVAFTDLAIDENGKATEAEIAALGVKCKGYASNAADFEQTHEVVKRIVEEFGRIDILVNNAGITKDGLMMRMSEAQWDAVLTVNLKSAFNFIHAVTPVMARQKSGSIINMSSVVGVSGNAGQCNYSASKAGMIGLAKSIAKEMGSRGIRANAIAPGFIMTENRQGDGPARHPRQLHRSGIHHHGHDRQVARRGQGGLVQADPAATRRYARRCGQGGPVPRVGPVVVRQRPGHPLLRRDELLTVGSESRYGRGGGPHALPPRLLLTNRI